MSYIDDARARDRAWGMIHDGWPTGTPCRDAAADRHALLAEVERLHRRLDQLESAEARHERLLCEPFAQGS